MYTPTLLLASLLAATVFATPITEAAPQDLETRAVPTNFKLQTKVINGKNDTGTKKGGLWVTSYHTGAGLSDATLTKNKTIGSTAHLNASNSALLFTLGTLNYPMVLDYEPYAAWSGVEISVATSNPTIGFFVNSTGLHSNYTSGAGWLACDWWHSEPQLFWTNGYYPNEAPPYPSSCSTVSLTVVGV